MATSKKLETIYYNGQPDGIRSIRRHLSTITTYVIPRPLLSEAKKISAITRPGIYYLINENDENKIAQIYIGQTRNGIARLDDHNRSKDFWNKAIMFLADNKTFSLDMISGLEEYAILKAHESKRYKVENSVSPKYEIDEYDLPSIEEVYDEIQFIMATLGYKMDDAKQYNDNREIFHTTRNGILAYGVYMGDKFQVLEGSQINLAKSATLEKYNKQRAELQASGDIVMQNGSNILKITLEFNTPSGASDFILGGSTNGWVEWKNTNGKTLDEVFRK
ncbi:MAG: GIY-YIG nuclease family protein [Clostridiales bacterium]|nr:GIY-YIG nuclease family protein [Clostridiales bacterium]MDY2971225.1 GIY-YIG nuclease family protein [Eubacteriales bacterium]MCI6946882.1 GIY-YIG nuclease family protein [Clostridiales bacterium]MDD7054963.1 GIY-YIG nuclease family protein [Clostridiales bacterium]MDY4934632.1 GIY-YIG nuclease family protein [Eubacteriales bacterium]